MSHQRDFGLHRIGMDRPSSNPLYIGQHHQSSSIGLHRTYNRIGLRLQPSINMSGKECIGRLRLSSSIGLRRPSCIHWSSEWESGLRRPSVSNMSGESGLGRPLVSTLSRRVMSVGTFRSASRCTIHLGRGQWRLPKELLSNPNIVNAIKEEATRILDAMCVDENQNFGAMWYGWLKRMKKRLQTCHRHHLQHWKDTLHQLKLAWLAARQNAADDEDAAGRIAATRDAYDTTKSEYEQLLKDQQFDFHANVNERGTSHFFRRPRDYKVPICTATIDGVAVTDKAAVQAAFTDHW
ncbi:hypothetical protein DYB26_012909, partial [Aphanomyces astaci]